MVAALNPDTGFDVVRFVIALSSALEMADESLGSHQGRTAFIAMRLAERMGFERERARDVFFAAILHDVGALSPEEKHELHSNNAQYVERHTRVGQALLRPLPYFARAADIVRLHHTPWRECADAAEPALAAESGIVALADAIERSIQRNRYILFQRERISSAIAGERGSLFAPEAVDAFLDLAGAESFWLDLDIPHLAIRMERTLPFGRLDIRRDGMVEVSEFVRQIIDSRTPFTATHSSGVSAAARELGRAMGLSPSMLRGLEVAGNIHDIGKMAVGDAILLKPGSLDANEETIMRQHSYHSYQFARDSGMGLDIASWAGFHHERLDGSGYPFHHDSGALDVGSRILAVSDVITALAEDRPYRQGLGRDDALHIVSSMADDGALDAEVVARLAMFYDDVIAAAMVAQRGAVERYARQMSV